MESFFCDKAGSGKSKHARQLRSLITAVHRSVHTDFSAVEFRITTDVKELGR